MRTGHTYLTVAYTCWSHLEKQLPSLAKTWTSGAARTTTVVEAIVSHAVVPLETSLANQVSFHLWTSGFFLTSPDQSLARGLLWFVAIAFTLGTCS